MKTSTKIFIGLGAAIVVFVGYRVITAKPPAAVEPAAAGPRAAVVTTLASGGIRRDHTAGLGNYIHG